MSKTILITGATDGIGLVTARKLRSDGHTLLLHGRNEAKLEAAKAGILDIPGSGDVLTFRADFSRLEEVARLVREVTSSVSELDVLINNAGILRTPNEVTEDGLDIRFVVNLLAPCLLTRGLLSVMSSDGRVVNLSSAAQAPVELQALEGRKRLSAMDAYAQSKLALTMWTRQTASELGPQGPAIIAVNPGSLLASKMVKEGFGVAGSDLGIGADILIRASLSEDFSQASGRYFDNDSGHFSDPHPDGLNDQKVSQLMDAVDGMLLKYS